MKATATITLFLTSLLLGGTAFAQDIRHDEADVFLTIEREWEASRKDDHDKIATMLTSEFMCCALLQVHHTARDMPTEIFHTRRASQPCRFHPESLHKQLL